MTPEVNRFEELFEQKDLLEVNFNQPFQPFSSMEKPLSQKPYFSLPIYLHQTGEGEVVCRNIHHEEHQVLPPNAEPEKLPVLITSQENTSTIVYPYGSREIDIYFFPPLEKPETDPFVSLQLPFLATPFLSFLEKSEEEIWDFKWRDLQKNPCLLHLPANLDLLRKISITFHEKDIALL